MSTNCTIDRSGKQFATGDVLTAYCIREYVKSTPAFGEWFSKSRPGASAGMFSVGKPVEATGKDREVRIVAAQRYNSLEATRESVGAT